MAHGGCRGVGVFFRASGGGMCRLEAMGGLSQKPRPGIRLVVPGLPSREALERYLEAMDDDYIPRLSSRGPLSVYATKLLTYGTFALALTADGRLAGLLAFYANDPEGRTAYPVLLGVLPEWRSAGLGPRLLEGMLQYLRARRFRHVVAQTWSTNRALKYYLRLGFREVERVADRPGGVSSVRLRMELWPGGG